MNDDRDELLKEIGAALSIEPTPEFAAKVRGDLRQTRQYPVDGRVVLLAAAACVLAVLMTNGPGPDSPALSQVAAPSTPVAPAVPLATPVVGRPGTTAETVVQRSARARVRPADARVEPDVMVSDDERRIFWQLLAEPPREAVVFLTAPATRSAGADELTPLPAIAAIEIPALSVPPLKGDDTGGLDE